MEVVDLVGLLLPLLAVVALAFLALAAMLLVPQQELPGPMVVLLVAVVSLVQTKVIWVVLAVVARLRLVLLVQVAASLILVVAAALVAVAKQLLRHTMSAVREVSLVQTSLMVPVVELQLL